MDTRIRFSILAILTLGGSLAPAALAAQDSLPAGVTAAMIQQGKKVFTGPGICFACHGMEAKGATGPNLTDTVWIHNRGEYDRIVALITSGVTAKQSKSGVVMPPKGGSAINDADVRAVAAYVWSLSRSAVVAPRRSGPDSGSCGNCPSN
jgi:mono/diheme cytochrome c family protein